MDKHTVAQALYDISRYLELQEPNKFRSMAFKKAARSVESLQSDLADVIRRGNLEKTPGIGKAIGPMIVEMVSTGSTPYLDELRAKYPPGIFDLLKVSGLSLKRIGWLHENMGVNTIEDLERIATEGKLRSAPGFGKKTEEKILAGIEEVKVRAGRFLLKSILEVAELVAARLREIEGVVDAQVAGSIRRRLEIVQNINIVVSAKSPKKFAQRLMSMNMLQDAHAVDESTTRGRLRGDLIVEVVAVTPDAFASALLVRTGNLEFVAALDRKARTKGLSLETTGVVGDEGKIDARDEGAIFKLLGLPEIPPELRDSPEVLRRRRPVKLIEPGDLRGTFHVHTTYSDGRNTLYEMLDAAEERGLEYVGISDHSKTAAYAGGLNVDRLKEQYAEIEKVRKAFESIRIFRGTEADILQDGGIDWDTRTLATFDFVIASVHSRFKMERDAMTARIVRALQNPFVTILGHMTGRLLLSRAGYDLDYARIFEAAAENGVMIEINGNPNRLDIDWRLLRDASTAGVMFCINPDAHSTSELDNTLPGVWVARKGGMAPEQIFNTRSAAEVEEYLTKRRERAIGLTSKRSA